MKRPKKSYRHSDLLQGFITDLRDEFDELSALLNSHINDDSKTTIGSTINDFQSRWSTKNHLM